MDKLKGTEKIMFVDQQIRTERVLGNEKEKEIFTSDFMRVRMTSCK